MSGRMPAWLEEWLDVGSSAAGEGTVWRLDAHWGWASWLTLLAATIAVAWIIYFYARESSDASRRFRGLLILLRLGAMTTLIAMLVGLVVSLQRIGLPTVAVIVDVSGSMSVGQELEDADKQTRLNQVKWLLTEHNARWLRKIDDRYRLVVYSAATSATLIAGDFDKLVQTLRDLTPDGPGSRKTRLGAVIRQVLGDLKGSPPAAIVLLSDGITTDGETLADAADAARRRGVPLFTVGLGNDKPIRDIELADLLVDDIVFAGDIVTFEATLVPRGLADTEVTITLKEAADDRILAETTATLGPDRRPQKIRLSYRPTQIGDFEFTVEVVPIDGEIQTENNRLTRLVRVREEKVRVLLAQAYPSYEYRFLKHMLERDTTIELNVHLQEADPDYTVVDQSAIPVFPVRREELFTYDVLILGDIEFKRMTQSTLTNIREFVEQKGGGLVFIAGERFFASQCRDVPEISALLPFHSASVQDAKTVDAGFVIQPTDLGLSSGLMQIGDSPQESQRLWKDLPPVYWLLELGKTNPAARVLARHPTRSGTDGRKLPVFVLQFLGAGKVLFHATDETWRWRFRVGDTFFARYWVQSLRYLARAKLLGGDQGVELSVNRHEYRRGEPVRVRVRFFDESLSPAANDGVTVVVDRTGGKRRRITLHRDALHRGVFEATLAAVEAGRYHVSLVRPSLEGHSPAADFRVVAPPGELERLEMNATELAEAAELSHGRFYHIEEAGNVPDDLPEGRQVPIQELPPLTLWNRWWMLVFFFGLLLSEWVLRKRKSMM